MPFVSRKPLRPKFSCWSLAIFAMLILRTKKECICSSLLDILLGHLKYNNPWLLKSAVPCLLGQEDFFPPAPPSYLMAVFFVFLLLHDSSACFKRKKRFLHTSRCPVLSHEWCSRAFLLRLILSIIQSLLKTSQRTLPPSPPSMLPFLSSLFGSCIIIIPHRKHQKACTYYNILRFSFILRASPWNM